MSRLWDTLTGPSPRLAAALHMQARLLSASLLVLFFAGLAGFLGLMSSLGADEGFGQAHKVWLAATGLVGLLYATSRTGYYAFSAWLFVAGSVVVPLAAAISAVETRPDAAMLLASISLLGVAGAAMLLGRGAALLAGMVAVGVAVVLPTLSSGFELEHGRWVILFMLFMTALMVASAHQRRLTEQLGEAQAEARRFEMGARNEVMQSALDAIVVMDERGYITDWNPSAVQLFGHSRAHAVGKTLHELIIPMRLRDAHKAGLERYLRTGRGRMGGRRVELPALHAAGHTFPVEVAMSPLRTPEGAVIFWAFVRDLTEQREIEEQLARARDEALEGSRLKSEFLANMSHEIRTPMNGVIGMTGLLLDTSLSDEQREYAETVRSCGESLLAVINDILDFSKVEAGHLELESVEFDVRTTIEEAVELLASKAQERGLDLVCAMSPILHASVAGDPGRLRQVVINLVDNAIKFTPRGHVLVKVESTPVDSDWNDAEQSVRLNVEVRDTGIGIDPSRAARLFQPFTQADMSTTRRFGGTGLGLSICKQIVELMGGHIGARPSDSQGGGSVFWFDVPLQRLPPRTDRAREALDDIEAAGRHALVVMRNAAARDALMADIGTFGLRVDGVGTVRDAKRALADKTFDVVLCDAALQDGDSSELMLWLRGREDAVPVVLLVDRTRSGQARRMRRDGAVRYLTKPVRRGHLADRLHSVLRKHRAAAAVRLAPTTIPPTEAGRAKPRILVAEDNGTNARLTVHMLEHMGYRADVVANGIEALDALGRQPYAAVIMDCHMPEMDGFEATRQLRARQAHTTRTPVVALTANAHVRTRQECLNAGMDDYLTKPVSYGSLKSLLDRYAPLQERENEGEDEVLDKDALAAIDELQQPGMPDLLCELMTLYLAQSREALEVLRRAAVDEDADTLGFKAHELKSSSASLGALGASDVFKRIEGMGKSGNIARIDALLDELTDELHKTWQAMEAMVASRSEPAVEGEVPPGAVARSAE